MPFDPDSGDLNLAGHLFQIVAPTVRPAQDYVVERSGATGGRIRLSAAAPQGRLDQRDALT